MENTTTPYKDYGYAPDKKPHHHSYLLKPVLKLIPKGISLRILDIGCGDGQFTNELRRKGYDIYGIDASESGIAIASLAFPNCFAVQDIASDKLPEKFKGLKFNTIISTEVIEHLYDPRQFIQFCKKILLVNNTGGELILTTPYHGYLKNLAISIFGMWDTHMDPTWEGGHIKFWSKKTITKLLIQEGFTVTDFIGCGRYPYLWKSMAIKATIKQAH